MVTWADVAIFATSAFKFNAENEKKLRKGEIQGTIGTIPEQSAL